MGYVMNGSYPYLEGLDEPIKVLLDPYPEAVYVQNKNEYPKFTYLDSPIKVLLDPYPEGVYVQEKGKYPSRSGLELVRMGAFTYASNLEEVMIPRSVKYIGEWAFRFTKLKEVTVASNCVYYPTSFPDGCTVNFYNSRIKEAQESVPLTINEIGKDLKEWNIHSTTNSDTERHYCD